jgi:putative membrane protein
MERPQHLNISPKVAVIMIILFHAVGLIGFCIPALRPLFLQIVPFHLLLMLIVIILSHQNRNDKFLAFVLAIFLSGFFLEWLGIHKYWLFGNYEYGKTLGVKLFDVPLTIGINWFLLIYATGVTLQHSRLKSAIARVITGAAILVVLDLLIEPVAIAFDYWSWDSNIIPVKNYICWFFVSAAMLYVFELFQFKKQSRAGMVLLITEFIFFGILGAVVRL